MNIQDFMNLQAGASPSLATALGISAGFLVLILIWTIVWKGIALWKPQKFLISDGYQKSEIFEGRKK